MTDDETIDIREAAAVKAWLKDLRAKTGWTQNDVAEMLGVTGRTIINLESPDEGFPRGLTMVRYLRALGVVADAPVETPGLGRLAALEEAASRSSALQDRILELLLALTALQEGQDPPQASEADAE